MSFILSSGWNAFNKLSFWLKYATAQAKRKKKRKEKLIMR